MQSEYQPKPSGGEPANPPHFVGTGRRKAQAADDGLLAELRAIREELAQLRRDIRAQSRVLTAA